MNSPHFPLSTLGVFVMTLTGVAPFSNLGWQRLAEVRNLELVRGLFRRPLELWLLLDRARSYNENQDPLAARRLMADARILHEVSRDAVTVTARAVRLAVVATGAAAAGHAGR